MNSLSGSAELDDRLEYFGNSINKRSVNYVSNKLHMLNICDRYHPH
ncbi:MAG: hypothetical protein RMX68_026920 [Aulosira sp. ZfuVER01]|nr:hypothetical protein [Aulosira sp. ZfuVER01]MDZ8000185.1 hypothetical protein [Aulosira sp. DedVER01a]MDZ8055693.1 hypothetical protein [Aulosira sp. ZfuCHP01]